jgi:hypothetical protein
MESFDLGKLFFSLVFPTPSWEGFEAVWQSAISSSASATAQTPAATGPPNGIPNDNNNSRLHKYNTARPDLRPSLRYLYTHGGSYFFGVCLSNLKFNLNTITRAGL